MEAKFCLTFKQGHNRKTLCDPNLKVLKDEQTGIKKYDRFDGNLRLSVLNDIRQEVNSIF
jgi:hypothetical protein